MEDGGDHLLLQDSQAGVLEVQVTQGRDSQEGLCVQEGEEGVRVQEQGVQGRKVPEGRSIDHLEAGAVVDGEGDEGRVGKVTGGQVREAVRSDSQDAQSLQGLECDRRHVSQAVVIEGQFFQGFQSDEGIVIDARDMIEGEIQTPEAG